MGTLLAYKSSLNSESLSSKLHHVDTTLNPRIAYLSFFKLDLAVYLRIQSKL